MILLACEKNRKAQFFIISAVIVTSILLMASRNLSDSGAIGLSRGAESVELDYIPMIMKSLNSSVRECDRMDEDISAAETFLSGKLAEQGIGLSAKHQIVSCGSVKFGFNLSSQNFFSSTEFWYP